jgi:HK97 family phage portal protein
VALLFGRRRRELVGDFSGATAADMIPARSTYFAPGIAPVNNETALRHSAVWACLRLRANLVSTMPVDVFRKVGGIQVEMPKPPILVNPGGERVDWVEWMYSSQVDLDRAGNAVGLITERNPAGLPNRIDLQPIDLCSLRTRKGVTKWFIDGIEYPLDQVWHEKQYTVAGFPVGLSPVAYAAWSIGEYLSIQDFALTWFGNGGMPRAHLKNKMQTISPAAAAAVKDRFKSTVAAGDVFVTGADWEYDMIQAQQTGMEWLEAKRYGIGDIARFFDVPGDLIDAATQSGNITYANVTQRNMQFLIYNLGPAIARRETRLSQLLPQPRYVKLNTSALLRMDDQTRAQVIQTRIASRTMTPNEARALENQPPLTSHQLTEFHDLFGDPKATQTAATTLGA